MSNFVVNADDTVTDTVTGLMWKRAAEDGQFTFDEAVERFVGKDEFAGFNDWRSPTIDELKTLQLATSPYYDREAFAHMPSFIWSCSTYAVRDAFGDAFYAEYQHFGYGESNGRYRDGYYSVLLVRGGVSIPPFRPYKEADFAWR